MVSLGPASVSLSSMSNGLLNALEDFRKKNYTAESLMKKNLVPYVDQYNCILEKEFVFFFENGFDAALAYDELCDKVFAVDKNTSFNYEVLLIAIFVVLLLIPLPLLIIFVGMWILLLRKQSTILSLYSFLPKETLASTYHEIKKKNNHEQTKEFASNYNLRLFCFSGALGIVFYATSIFSFVVTVVCLLDSINNLNAIKDASGVQFSFFFDFIS